MSRLVYSFLAVLIHVGVTAQTPLEIHADTLTVKGHQAFMMLPGSPAPNKPWVWYAPTLPGLPAAEEAWMFRQFLDAGIAIAGIDVGESYGSPDGRKLFTAFYTELVKKRGFSTRPVLLGRSRGGLQTLSWAADHPTMVAAFAGIYPVCNLESYPGLEKAAPAYHLTAISLKRALSQQNPLSRIPILAKHKIPLFAIHGDIDELVPLDLNSGAVKKTYDSLQAPMQLVIPKGQGHNMWEGFFQSQELVNFVLRSAK